MFAASIQGGGVLAKASLIAAQVQCRPDSPWENRSVGVGPVCRTSLSTGLSEWELGPRHTEWSPIFPPLFLVRTAIDPTKLATCWSFTQHWENNLQVCQSTQSIIISKQPVAPKTHILRLSPSIIVRQ